MSLTLHLSLCMQLYYDDSRLFIKMAKMIYNFMQNNSLWNSKSFFLGIQTMPFICMYSKRQAAVSIMNNNLSARAMSISVAMLGY